MENQDQPNTPHPRTEEVPSERMQTRENERIELYQYEGKQSAIQLDPTAPLNKRKAIPNRIGIDGVVQWIVVVVAVLLCVTSYPDAFAAVSKHFIKSPDVVPSQKWGDLSEIVVSNYVETARSILEAALTLLAASWGFVAIQKDHASWLLSTRKTKIIFLLGSMCLILSCLSFLRFNYDLTFYLQIAQQTQSVPNLNHASIITHLNAQVFGITSGAVCIALTVVSASWFTSKTKGLSQ